MHVLEPSITPASIDSVFDLAADDMGQVDALIRDCLASDVEQALAAHDRSAGGPRPWF